MVARVETLVRLLKTTTIMLQAKTKEQKEKVSEILDTLFWCSVDETGIDVEAYITYDKLAELVDYLRSVNRRLDIAIVDEPMQEVVNVWLQYKKEKGQSYKPTGFKTFYKKLCELSGNDPQKAMAIIEQSMANNYAGIFELKQSNNYGRETITEKMQRTAKNATEFKQRIDAKIGREADMGGGDSDKVW